MTTLLSHLKARGCIHDASHFEELERLLESEQVTFYAGFDPTADSLHVGSMLPLVIMRMLQKAGHKPLVILGSATGMIGDPSGKSDERQLLMEAEIDKNLDGIERQIGTFLSKEGDNGYVILKNNDWLKEFSYIEFLRDVGKHFSVNAMIAKESVRQRLENREQGISYTEFSYMLLQAFDFYWLNQNHNCRLQVGGSDQWGNITAGAELIRKKTPEEHPQAYGLTFPLLTTSSGAKFGKTESGTVWLDPEKTSPYQFYQYWFNTSDEDVIRYLKLFTEVEEDEIESLEHAVKSAPEKRAAQERLASTLCDLLHGAEETKKSQRASSVLFGGDIRDADSETLKTIFSDVPSCTLSAEEASSGISLQDLLVRCTAAKSKSAARRLIDGGGIYVNNERVEDIQASLAKGELIDGEVAVLRSGKKNYFLVQVEK